MCTIAACRQWQGEPRGAEGQDLAWVTADQLDSFPMPPLDFELLTSLRPLLKKQKR